MSVKFIDFTQQHKVVKNEINRGFQKIIERGDFILGEKAKLFEEEFAKFCHAKYGVGVNSGTDALYIAVSALGIGPGDEVILPTYTFIATALCVSYTGATPVFVDIEEETYNIDPEKLKKAITSKTKAVIPVHLYGQPANMKEINVICKKHGIAVIEDAAQSHGALYQGNRVGSLGDVACFSFYPTKSLGAFGDGGMVITNREDIYKQSLMLRDYGRTGRYDHKIKGHNSRLDTMQAVVLLAKLKHLDKWNKMRLKNAQYYCQLLKKIPGVVAPIIKDNRSHVFQTFAIRVKNRDQVMEAMKKENIGVLIHYPIPIHLQQAYSEIGHKKGDFPVSEKVCEEILSLPMYPHMTKKEIEKVCVVLKRTVK